jgi:hypothetical protein
VTPGGDSPELPPVSRPGRRVDWRVRGTIAAAFLVAGIAMLAWQWHSDRASLSQNVSRNVQEQAHRIEQAHGIRIGYGSPADFWTPPFKAEDATAPGVELKPAALENVAIALDGIEAGLNQYPPRFVARLIHAIFICGELRMGGVEAGGTAGPAWIIVAAPSDLGAEGIRTGSLLDVHHELSSFVLRVNPLTRVQWSEFAPADWDFVAEAGGALRRAGASAPSPDTGFLSAYGATNLENDFNVYAEKMFTEPDSLARLAQAYPLIRRKLDFVRATYVAIDPAFAERFQRLGLDGDQGTR